MLNSFSISELSQFSGVKPHTIRMWEQRYKALQPARSEGNTRSYDGNQLRRLLNIVSLSEEGYRISDLCPMPDKQLFSMLQAKDAKTDNYFIAQLIVAAMSFDDEGFQHTFSHCLLRFGMKDAYTTVFYPMLVRLGLMWSADVLRPPHEHLVSNIIRQKLFTAIDALPSPKYDAETWLLFLPENEFHEIGLLLANYLIRLAGCKVIYLGCNVPLQTIGSAAQHSRVNNLLCFLVHNDDAANTIKLLGNIAREFPKQKIHVAASAKIIGQLKPKKIIWVSSVADLDKVLLEQGCLYNRSNI